MNRQSSMLKVAAVTVGLLALPQPAAADAILSQYMLELVNALRANPQSLADLHLSGDLNEGLAPGTITAAAKQPLAFNSALNAAAEQHTSAMIAGNFFAHVDTENRIVAAGYPFGINNPSSFGENIWV